MEHHIAHHGDFINDDELDVLEKDFKELQVLRRQLFERPVSAGVCGMDFFGIFGMSEYSDFQIFGISE